MQFKRITKSDSKEFKQVWKLYESSFPADERRSLQDQLVLLQNPRYSFNAVYDKKLFIGFISVWDINPVFIEHFAIVKNLRGNGYGTKLITELLSRFSAIVLEVERPIAGELAVQRIKFYEKCGFYCNTFNYIQPPYSKTKNPVPLYLMTYPSKISQEEFNRIRDLLYETVYCITTPFKAYA